MLKLDAVHSGYGSVAVLNGVSLTIDPGEILGLLGRNGAGKTTLLKTIMGLVKPQAGRITLGNVELSGLAAHEIPGHGVAYVPQGRGLFAEFSVAENLRMGLLAGGQGGDTLDRALALFPVLAERLNQTAGTLSGGEQQMLAMARALCLAPKLLLLDEPNEGLMPSIIDTLLHIVVGLKSQGVAVLLVEQKVPAVLKVADRVLFLEGGVICHESTPHDLKRDPDPLQRYVGVSR